ncbi:hypothetical protein FUA23_09215 [Neolewinella aurantiaca]|uniref:Lipoprotein n=1 Tax=Neolewinella aurantiaca TaxID=2602767 RepID=A0A5C7FU90_9BACT|nr:hypothetical protein [Neolewinella aurantiaca]TXF89852.1 hypothetical protein FUA23_09215 [Neolewinella aurantiaca]
MGKVILIYVICIFSLSLFSSCDENANNHKINDVDVFSNEFLGYGLFEPAPLRITAYFSECGEFGDHFEEVLVSKIEDNKYLVNLIQYDLSCGPPPPPINGNEVDYRREEVINNDSIIITNFKSKVILRYIHEVVSAKLLEENFVHSGQAFTIENMDSTMFISLYGNDKNNEVRYVQFIKGIGFEPMTNEYNYIQ